ncbi:MAG TPA: Ig-like domain-containing protein [Terracidiphilus sp.]|nr:Ig-like domain-containing protein [Terracidiphilus sp.]
MRSWMGRGVRLELVAGLGIALALPALAFSAEAPRGLATETTLAAATRDVNGRTQATLTVTVLGQDGQPAAGAVTIEDSGKPLAGVALNGSGTATAVLTLTPGNHSLKAVYAGDTAHLTSTSEEQPVSAVTGAAPDFSVAVAPATLTLKQGQSGSVTATITPLNASSLTAPMFVTLSCSGLPDQSSCTFTPENLEILPNTTATVTSSVVLATVGSNTLARTAAHEAHGVQWAVLLPGVLGLAGMAFGARRRAWLRRLSLLGLLALVTTLGTAACNPLYGYRNRGPNENPATPVGSYTLNVTAQSSNGVTATTHSTTMVLTVQQ